MRSFLLCLPFLALAGSVQAQQPAATITSVAPTFGPPGTTVSIRGAGLNGFETGSAWVKEIANEPAPGAVEFNGVTGDVLFWQDDLITVKVPHGASTGPVRVITPGGSIDALVVFDVYYSTSQGRPAGPHRAENEPLRRADSKREDEEREQRLGPDDSAPPFDPFYVNPWFSGLSPGRRTFWGEHGLPDTLLFGDPFSLGPGASVFSGREGFRNHRSGFHRPFFGKPFFGKPFFGKPFFGTFFFGGSRAVRISPFGFRFK
jgi:hypothetical protein